ncbi:MAG: hypothetical protein ACLRH0_13280 [Blautia wexlerae]
MAGQAESEPYRKKESRAVPVGKRQRIPWRLLSVHVCCAVRRD